MNWLDLYNFLYAKAHDVNNPDQKFWQSDVVVHDADTGEEMKCEIIELGLVDRSDDSFSLKKTVLAANYESIFEE